MEFVGLLFSGAHGDVIVYEETNADGWEKNEFTEGDEGIPRLLATLSELLGGVGWTWEIFKKATAKMKAAEEFSEEDGI